MRTWCCAMLLLCLMLMVLSGDRAMAGKDEAEVSAPAAAESMVLDTYSYWRRFLTFRPLEVARTEMTLREKSDEQYSNDRKEREDNLRRLQAPEIGYTAEHLGFRYKIRAASCLPPANWMQPEFDDVTWWRSPGPWFPGHGDDGVGYNESMPGWSFHAALLCLRGSFQVSDPAHVKHLSLSITYRGGIVVYLNGTEVARGHLPGGAIDFETAAEQYPQEAYLTPEGKSLAHIPTKFLWGLNDYRAEERNAYLAKYKERYATRFRHIEAVRIPASLLKKGTNVLAVEIHRAAQNPVVVKEGFGWKERPTAWLTAGLIDLQLVADAANGTIVCCGRPKGLQVWNAYPFVSVFDVDYGEVGRGLRPVRIVGARNGAFWGQVVVGSDNPIKGLRAEMTGLKLAGGAGSIPASAMDIRYPQPNTTEYGLWLLYPLRGVRRFDVLQRTPPTEIPVRRKKMGKWAADGTTWDFGAVQPIWVQVKIPADAEPGDYKGNLTITAEGEEPVVVPIHLRVCPWKLPNPENFEVVMDFLQSPYWNVRHYGVERWSDEHWDLIAETLKILYTIGNRTVYIPLIAKTHLEHEQSIVRWVKQGEDAYTHDFSVVEKYLDTVREHMPSARVVVLIVFDRYMQERRIQDPIKRPGAPLVTLLDPHTGETREMKAPHAMDPKARDFWKPVIQGVRDCLEKRGLDKAIVLGLVNDYGIPRDETIIFWEQMCPDLGWLAMGHGTGHNFYKKARNLSSDQTFGCSHAGSAAFDKDCFYYEKEAYPYGCRWGWDELRPWDKLRKRYVSNPRMTNGKNFMVLFSGRDFLKIAKPIRNHRLAPEFNIQGSQAGVGFQPADWWYALSSREGRIVGNYTGTFTQWGNNGPTGRKLDPGPDGPLITVRFEMMREGVQECEARIYIEKALVDKERRVKLSEELVRKCEELIAERTRLVLRSIYSYAWYNTRDWHSHAETLFNTAAEVAEALRQ